jgi:inosine-uridine nucleoside N-ribohydrolase
MIELVMSCPEPITLISIAPVPSLAEALRREPRIAGKIHFVGMFGSIYRSHEGRPEIIAEYNVVRDIAGCRKVFSAPWAGMIITPLDTCGQVRLQGALYRRIEKSRDPQLRDIISNYQIWSEHNRHDIDDGRSSILFDTVAVHLASSRRFLRIQEMKLGITRTGFTVPDENTGHSMSVAIDWQDLPGYQSFLADVLQNRTHKLSNGGQHDDLQTYAAVYTD